jgi:hypothetical protein
LGGFKWSSQHLDEGGCDEEAQAFGSVWSCDIVVTGSTVDGWTRRAATVLDGDRGRHGE